MNKENSSDDQKLKLKEELIDKFIAFWVVEDNDYLDIMFSKITALIAENEDYRIFAVDEILFEAIGDVSFDEREAIISTYLYSGGIKDWVGFLNEIHNYSQSKPNSDDWSLAGYIFESERLVEDAIHGLARSLSKGEIASNVLGKLIPLLQNFPWKINGMPIFYLYTIICHGLIGSTKSIPFLKLVLVEIDDLSLGTRDSEREFQNDNFHLVRTITVKAFAKISRKDGANYLLERLNKEPSPSVKQIILHELMKFEIPNLFDGFEHYDKIVDLETNFYKYTKKFVLADFDDAYRDHL